MSSEPSSLTVSVHDPYQRTGGIFTPPVPVSHRDEEYDPKGFENLRRMQADHFWYRGRHRFLLHSTRHLLRKIPPAELRLIDLGGGCGGWIAYLLRNGAFPGAELALGDSSEVALRFAAEVLPDSVGRYQIDLMNLQWTNRWDAAFLLDVLEHIPDHEAALRQVHEALAPGGLLFVTVPALDMFWTWNDELAHHQRRYRRGDFQRLAADCGFRLRDSRYFMFFLSPLLLISRLTARHTLRNLPREQWRELSAKMHRVPSRPVNAALAATFASETPLGHLVHFPWGTSLLAVLEKPRS